MASAESNENYVSDALRAYAQQFQQLKSYRLSEDKLFEVSLGHPTFCWLAHLQQRK
jgi:hypothetical protein